MRREPVEIVDCPARGLSFDKIVEDEAREREWAEWCAAVDAAQRLRDPGVREPLRCVGQGTPLMPETRREMGVEAIDFGPVLG